MQGLFVGVIVGSIVIVGSEGVGCRECRHDCREYYVIVGSVGVTLGSMG